MDTALTEALEYCLAAHAARQLREVVDERTQGRLPVPLTLRRTWTDADSERRCEVQVVCAREWDAKLIVAERATRDGRTIGDEREALCRGLLARHGDGAFCLIDLGAGEYVVPVGDERRAQRAPVALVSSSRPWKLGPAGLGARRPDAPDAGPLHAADEREP